jgi:hypothetical protein
MFDDINYYSELLAISYGDIYNEFFTQINGKHIIEVANVKLENMGD